MYACAYLAINCYDSDSYGIRSNKIRNRITDSSFGHMMVTECCCTGASGTLIAEQNKMVLPQ